MAWRIYSHAIIGCGVKIICRHVYIYFHFDKLKVYVEIKLVPIQSEGMLLSLLTIFRDIYKLLRVEKKIEKLN